MAEKFQYSKLVPVIASLVPIIEDCTELFGSKGAALTKTQRDEKLRNLGVAVAAFIVSALSLWLDTRETKKQTL